MKTLGHMNFLPLLQNTNDCASTAVVGTRVHYCKQNLHARPEQEYETSILISVLSLWHALMIWKIVRWPPKTAVTKNGSLYVAAC